MSISQFKVMVWKRPDLCPGDAPVKPVSVHDVGDSATAIHVTPMVVYPDRYIYRHLILIYR